jgi:hypothetical protein
MSELQNGYLEIFKSIFPKNYDFKEKKIYFIRAFEATEAFDLNRLESINDFLEEIKQFKYNSQANNILVYLLHNINEKCNEIFLVTDPFDLFEKEQVIEHFLINIDENKLDDFERIY